MQKYVLYRNGTVSEVTRGPHYAAITAMTPATGTPALEGGRLPPPSPLPVQNCVSLFLQVGHV